MYAIFLLLFWYGLILRAADWTQPEVLPTPSVARTRQTSDFLNG